MISLLVWNSDLWTLTINHHTCPQRNVSSTMFNTWSVTLWGLNCLFLFVSIKKGVTLHKLTTIPKWCFWKKKKWTSHSLMDFESIVEQWQLVEFLSKLSKCNFIFFHKSRTLVSPRVCAIFLFLFVINYWTISRVENGVLSLTIHSFIFWFFFLFCTDCN